MKTGKKLLALFLAVIMTMSVMTVGTFAEESGQESGSAAEQMESTAGNIPGGPANSPADEPVDGPEKASQVSVSFGTDPARLFSTSFTLWANDTYYLANNPIGDVPISWEEVERAGGLYVHISGGTNVEIAAEVGNNTFKIESVSPKEPILFPAKLLAGAGESYQIYVKVDGAKYNLFLSGPGNKTAELVTSGGTPYAQNDEVLALAKSCVGDYRSGQFVLHITEKDGAVYAAFDGAENCENKELTFPEGHVTYDPATGELSKPDFSFSTYTGTCYLNVSGNTLVTVGDTKYYSDLANRVKQTVPGGSVFTKQEKAAEINGTPYFSLEEAVAVANRMEGPTVLELCRDINLGADPVPLTISAGKEVTIDFKGFTVTGIANYSKGLFVNLGTLTLKDSSGKKGGIDCAGKSSGCGVINGDKDLNGATGNLGKLTLENIKITSAGTGVYNKAGSTATINGCEFSGRACLVNNGIILTLADTKMTADRVAIKSQGADETQTKIGTITNCTIHGEAGYALQAMSLIEKVEDSVLTSGDSAVIQLSAAGSNANPELRCLKETTVTASKGDAIHVYGGAEVTIESGNYQAGPGKLAIADKAMAGSTVAVTITGGTFSSDVSEYLPEGLGQDANGTVGKVEAGFAAAKIGDTYYQTLAKAIAAAKENDTLTLLRDVDLGSDRVTVNKAVTLDLNGCTITSSHATNTLWLEASRVTVQDSKGNGKVTNTGSGNNNIAVVVNGKGTEAYFKSGTVSGNYAVFIQNGAKAVIEGGRYTGTYGVNTVGTNDETNKTTVEIRGGEVQAVAFAVSGNGSSDYTETVITGGRLESTEGNVIYHPQVGDLTIKGDSVLIGPNGVQYCGAGTLTIAENAAITATLPYTEFPTKPASQGDGSTDDGAALSVVSRGGGYQSDGQNMTVNITGGTLTSRNNAAVSIYRLAQVNGQWTTNNNTRVENYLAELTVSGGNFSAGSKKSVFEVDTLATDKVRVTGGYFTSDPSDYVPKDVETTLYVVASNKTGYSYMVTTTAPVEVDPIVIEKTKAEVSGSIGSEDKAKIEAVIGKAQVSGVCDAVTESARNAIINQVEGELKPKDKVVVEITVSLTAAKADLATEGKVFISYEADPVAKVTVNGAVAKENIDVPNTYLDGHTLIEVRLPIPGDMVPQEVMHISDSGTRERYLNDSGFTVEDGCAVLYVKHFSTFVLNGQLTVAAKIGDTEYGTLQEAVNAAKSGDTIVLTQNCDEPISVSGKSVTIDCDGHAYDENKITLGSRCGMSVSGDKIYITYSAPSGGGSSSSSGDYTVSVGESKYGTVTVSPKRADKGDTVTITVDPDKGYELDELTVTDSKGRELDLTDKGNGKYTFKMPGTRVEVEVSFKLVETEPEAPAFADVPASAYYADAVKWAVEQGITSGTSATTFSPDMSCTRAQIVTFLWRANGSPKADGANPFTDVSADAYYYDAVLWAVKEGITSGTSAATFSPDATVTRAQTVTFLYRAAGAPAVTGGSFADVAADVYYADAVAWAVKESVTSGTGGNNFSPDAPCTRGQIVTFMYRGVQ